MSWWSSFDSPCHAPCYLRARVSSRKGRERVISEGHPQTPGKGVGPLCTPCISVGYQYSSNSCHTPCYLRARVSSRKGRKRELYLRDTLRLPAKRASPLCTPCISVGCQYSRNPCHAPCYLRARVSSRKGRKRELYLRGTLRLPAKGASPLCTPRISIGCQYSRNSCHALCYLRARVFSRKGRERELCLRDTLRLPAKGASPLCTPVFR